MRLHHHIEIAVLGLEIGKHILVIDVGIILILQPVIGILDHIAMARIAVGAALGDGRGRGAHVVQRLCSGGLQCEDRGDAA